MAYYTTPSNYNFGYYPSVMQPTMVQQPMIYPQQMNEIPYSQPMNTQSSNPYFTWVHCAESKWMWMWLQLRMRMWLWGITLSF